MDKPSQVQKLKDQNVALQIKYEKMRARFQRERERMETIILNVKGLEEDNRQYKLEIAEYLDTIFNADGLIKELAKELGYDEKDLKKDAKKTISIS